MKDVYVVGDIHGAFTRFKDVITECDLHDCYLICVGDLGIGFQHPDKGELSQCEKLNTFFADNNIHFMSIRGNHDDPAYFNGEKRIELSNFKLLPDYHTEVINGQKFLFVGGGISIDRRGHHRVEGRSYWKDEIFVLDESKVVPCDVLVTHSAPGWIGPANKNGMIDSWCKYDLTLWDECQRERKDHEKLVELCNAKRHYCGHFHTRASVSHNGCHSTILDINEITYHRV